MPQLSMYVSRERDFFDRERMEKNDNLLNMLLHLIRNLLAIQDKPSTSTQSTESLEQSSLQVRAPSYFPILILHMR